MKAVVFTLGCKVNEVESASIMAGLEMNGWEVSDKLGFADIYVLNTCAVTSEAEKKSRQLISRARKFNPAARIYVCGCASIKNCAPFKEKGAEYVCALGDKKAVLEAVCADFGGECAVSCYPKQTKTRAFIKIQDGCNNFCSYCIIPYLRGREKSRPIDEILAEIKQCSSPEIVLTGINISSFNDGGKGLTELIKSLKSIKNRIRIGSLECSVITEEFLTSLSELSDFAQQFHLSLQSGSNAVLKAMNRHYTRGEYIEKCALIYRFFPDAAITTDIISGFPTETEQDFLESLSIIPEVGFARVHAFSFSPREGTAAYKMKDLPYKIKEERLLRLIEAAKKAEIEYVSRFSGRKLSFVSEEYDGSYTCGYTSNYIRVYVPEKLPSGKIFQVKIINKHADGALAEVDYEKQN